MSCTAYQSALVRLSVDGREIVETVMAAWHNVLGSDGAQLARNIEAESGLPGPKRRRGWQDDGAWGS